jgi:cytidylate kinase
MNADMTRLIVTIDGPAASGKSTVARLLADKLNATFLDTGAMYRAVTLAVMKRGNRRAGLAPPMISPQASLGVGHCEAVRRRRDLANGRVGRSNLFSQNQILDVLNKTQFEFTSSHNGMLVYMAGVDVTEQIRDPQVTANARYVAASAPARQLLVEMQRQFAAKHEKIVTEGRDQGTVAFPDADVKFFLTAGLDERARRRQAELKAKGIEQTTEQIRFAIQQRDASDEKRFVGPLKPAEDAIIIDTTNLTIELVVDKLVKTVKDNVKDPD